MRAATLALLLAACAPDAAADPAMNTPRPSPAGGDAAVENLLDGNSR